MISSNLKYSVIPEVFVLKESRSRYIIYSPLYGKLLRCGNGAIQILKDIESCKSIGKYPKNIINQLLEYKIILKEPKVEIEKCQTSFITNEYLPCATTIIPTYDCNLRCLYCYSRGGENISEVIPLVVAKKAVNFIIHNAKRSDNFCNLGFHGGGDPFYKDSFQLVRQLTNYFRIKLKQNNLYGKVTAATNCYLSSKKLDWILSNLDSVNLSLDGPVDIQQYQRPFIKKESDILDPIQVLSEIDKSNIAYGIRSTITSFSVSRMCEIIEYFRSIAPNVSKVHFEPMFKSGRGAKNKNITPPSVSSFITNSIKAIELANKYNIKVYLSGCEIEIISKKFCGAAGDNFYVTPLGEITTCLEITRKEDIGSDIFFIGMYNSQKNIFEFDENKIKFLRTRIVDNMPDCFDCFAKYNCSGGCLAKSMLNGNLFEECNTERCQINRSILEYRMKNILDQPVVA